MRIYTCAQFLYDLLFLLVHLAMLGHLIFSNGPVALSWSRSRLIFVCYFGAMAFGVGRRGGWFGQEFEVDLKFNYVYSCRTKGVCFSTFSQMLKTLHTTVSWTEAEDGKDEHNFNF